MTKTLHYGSITRKNHLRLSLLQVLILAGMVLVVSSYCGPTPTATPVPTATPLPTSMSVEKLYSIYQAHKAQNPTRVENYKRLELSSVFEGRITNIKGSTVQFHIQKLILESDKYVECKFKRESDVLNLNIGSVVRVLGDLEDVNGVVQFKNCKILQ